jgi:hypothetical protein
VLPSAFILVLTSCVGLPLPSFRRTAKFLIDHEGNPYKRYNATAPLDMKEDIEMLLKKKEGASSS